MCTKRSTKYSMSPLGGKKVNYKTRIFLSFVHFVLGVGKILDPTRLDSKNFGFRSDRVVNRTRSGAIVSTRLSRVRMG